MYNWSYYKMVKSEDSEVLSDEEDQQILLNRLKEKVSKYKYAVMDEDNEMVNWFETEDEAKENLNNVKKGGGVDGWYITEVTDEMRNKVINL